MKKIIITVAALFALSTGAFAVDTEHGGNGMDNKASMIMSNTKAFAVAPTTVKSKLNAYSYLNAHQLH